MREEYNWFVLYTRSNAEQRVIKDFKEAFYKHVSDYDCEPFSPESEYYYRQGKTKQLGKVYKKRPLFPSYVFIETDMPEADFVHEFSSLFYESPDIIRILRYGTKGAFAIRKDERAKFEYLFKGKRCLEHSEGYIEGDKITVTAGPLVGMEGYITHINRHNQVARIKIEMFDRILETNLALELIRKS